MHLFRISAVFWRDTITKDTLAKWFALLQNKCRCIDHLPIVPLNCLKETSVLRWNSGNESRQDKNNDYLMIVTSIQIHQIAIEKKIGRICRIKVPLRYILLIDQT